MDPVKNLFDIIVAPENAGIIAIAAAAMTVIVRILPSEMRESGWVARALPVLPVPLCMGIVWIPGLQAVEGLGMGDTLALAAALGCGLSWGFKVLMQSILGKDERIAKAKAIKNGVLK
jgi:hypothetical protein